MANVNELVGREILWARTKDKRETYELSTSGYVIGRLEFYGWLAIVSTKKGEEWKFIRRRGGTWKLKLVPTIIKSGPESIVAVLEPKRYFISPAAGILQFSNGRKFVITKKFLRPTWEIRDANGKLLVTINRKWKFPPSILRRSNAGEIVVSPSAKVAELLLLALFGVYLSVCYSKDHGLLPPTSAW